MKPGDHPDFYRIAPPPGTSRESTIRLDAEGSFWHDGERVDHEALAKAMHGWITRHPDDGRYILSNGYDWTYFRVDDVPYIVRAIALLPEAVVLKLSDETEERLSPETLCVGPADALYARVKNGQFEARFSRHAQASLGPIVEEGEHGKAALRVGGERFEVPERR
ncbi:MAG TPA: hypothetical protein VJT73_01640 [Polyangiaceae bacterium]|nr:hypothetical protein [Polyangiaceae bacterium]